MNGEFNLKWLCKLLFKEGFISEEQENEIIANGEKKKDLSPIDVILSLKIKKKELSEERITQLIAEELKLPYVKIDPLKLNSDLITQIISRPFAERHRIIPLSTSEENLVIATDNPFDDEAIEMIKMKTGKNIEVVMSLKTDILKIITEFYGFKSSVSLAERDLSREFELGNLEQYVKMKSDKDIEASDKHVINAVEYLLRYAYDQRASDIHVEPKRNRSLIRFRIDGVLHNVYNISKILHPPIISRIKTLARMDIAEKRRPQDGRIKTNYKGRDVELRISVMPVAFGEKVVIRIFDPDILMQNLTELGFFGRELRLFQSFIEKPYGIILVTGPTGSGKTTTLYSALKALSTPDVNIITIEDPIEMVYEDFNQIGVQPQIDLNFANALRTILRQDPDIIMVGEIRDFETAENAIQAALTGHLVLSTLHTNDAPSAITRMIDLGIEPFLISSTVIGVIAQRLLRKICPYCKKTKILSDEEKRILNISFNNNEKTSIKYGEGCSNCRFTGYIGRTGIFEIMEVNNKIGELIYKKVDSNLLKKVAKEEGMITLRMAAIKKMLQGITTFEEVISIT